MPASLTITEAHRKLQRKEISCRELIESCINRIETFDDVLKAVVHRNFENALTEADRIDTEGNFDHPLTGIPFLAKDNFCERGIPSVGCSNVLRKKDYVPPFESTTTKRLKAHGAISIGKSNTDEFTMGASSETSCFGPSFCPWDPTRIAGGSTGGSASGVSADFCLFGLGTDAGGSIRLPASFCGCVSIRPTYGRSSRYGVVSMTSSLDTIGTLAKTTEDLAITLQAIAGRDPYDATTAEIDVPDYLQFLQGNIKGMRIGLPKEYFIDGIDLDVENAVREAASVLQSLGATVTEISLPHTKYAVATYCVISRSEVSSNMARYDGIRYGHIASGQRNLIDYYHSVRSEGFGDEAKRRIMLGTFSLSAGYYDAYYRHAQKVRTLIKQDFDKAFKDIDIIITPTSPTTAFVSGAHDDDLIAMYLEDIFLDAQPMAGVPALNVPCGFSKAGLPIGLQIVGPQWGEGTILKAAHVYEQATEWHTKKAPLQKKFR